MTQGAIKAWYLVHKWTSLACMLFMLMLCVTGLPLIFYEEIDHATAERMGPVPAGARPPTLDQLVASATAAHPGDKMMYLSPPEDEPGHDPVYFVTSGPRPDATDAEDMHIDQYDARSGLKMARPPLDEGVMAFIFQLHANMLLGLPGELFLGLMGLVLVASIVSGAVVYAPFMRRLDFGTVRKAKSRRVRWLDTHNMLGIVTLAWLTVVTVTGVINTLALPITAIWQANELADMTRGYEKAAPPTRFASVDVAVKTALDAAPGMKLSFIAFPGTYYTSKHHYGVFMTGNTPLTERLAMPALIDAETGALTAIRELPWYAKALFISQPLHFGDYGGLPLKIIWALLDAAAIVVLGSGIYLWLGKRRSPIERRLAEIRTGAALEVPA